MSGLYSSLRPSVEEVLQTSVSKALDHLYSVTPRFTERKWEMRVYNFGGIARSSIRRILVIEGVYFMENRIRYHETVSREYVNDLCDAYLALSALRREADLRAFGVAIGRAEAHWAKSEIDLELSIRLTMGALMRFAPDAVQFIEGY
jgi:hypothetical protein